RPTVAQVGSEGHGTPNLSTCFNRVGKSLGMMARFKRTAMPMSLSRNAVSSTYSTHTATNVLSGWEATTTRTTTTRTSWLRWLRETMLGGDEEKKRYGIAAGSGMG